ncbi:hypothetical protein T484DRAFT_1753941 [Baffinella frigidus]|nr:hypothetical protein T484DRAFT_1753941 [Cryptophyta sp. CCMP2293]
MESMPRMVGVKRSGTEPCPWDGACTPPGKRLRFQAPKPIEATLGGHKFLYVENQHAAQVEKTRITDSVVEWVRGQPQFAVVEDRFLSYTFAVSVVDGILAWQGQGGTKPIMAVKACQPHQVTMSLEVMGMMKPTAPQRVPRTVAEMVLDDLRMPPPAPKKVSKTVSKTVAEAESALDDRSWRFELDTSVDRPRLDVSKCGVPPMSSYATVEEMLPTTPTILSATFSDEDILSTFSDEDIYTAVPSEGFDDFYDPRSFTLTGGFDDFYDSKDVTMPIMPSSTEFARATLEQRFEVPKKLATAITIVTGRQLLLATVMVLGTVPAVMDAALELQHMFHDRIKFSTVLFGQSRYVDVEALVKQREDVRDTIEKCGVVVCVRETSAIREVMDIFAEIKNDEASVLGKMITHRHQRHEDAFTFNLVRSAIKLVDVCKDMNLDDAKKTAAQRLAFQLGAAEKKVPLSNETLLANKMKANERIILNSDRFFSVDSNRQVKLKGSIWTDRDRAQTTKGQAHQTMYMNRMEAKLGVMRTKWFSIAVTETTCLGFVMITDDWDETDEARVKDCVKQGQKKAARDALKAAKEETEKAAKVAVHKADAMRVKLAAVETPLLLRNRAFRAVDAAAAAAAAALPSVKVAKPPSQEQTRKDIRKLMRSFTAYELDKLKKLDTITPHCVLSLYGKDSRCIWAPSGPQ